MQILWILNKYVDGGSLSRYYPDFLRYVEEEVAKSGNKIHFLFFSDAMRPRAKTTNNFFYEQKKITEDASAVANKIENEYQFTFKQAYFPDQIQVSKRQDYRKINLLEKEFCDLVFLIPRFQYLEQIINHNNIDVVFCDQSPEVEMEFARAICMKKNKVFLRQSESFLGRCVFYQQLEFGKEKVSITAPVLGAHQAENITASILGAYAVGLPLTILITRAAKLTSYNKTMQKIAGINDSIFIDDTSNNNPDAALAALEYIAKLSGKKYLVFQPMLELANQAESAHEKVARQAVQICEEIYLTNGSYYNSFVKGAKQTKDTVRVFAFSAQKTADILRKKIKEGDVILFKGKEAIHTLKNLQKWR